MSEVDGGMRTNEHSGPWNSVNVGGAPDRTFDAALLAMFMSVFGGPGVLSDLLQSMEVTPTSPASMTLRVGLGAAMVGPNDDVQRIAAIWPSRQQITLNRQTGNNDRIDLLGIRINANSRNGTLAVIAGTPANNPVAPAIPDAQTRDAYFFELAQISVIGGANTLAASKITDRRSFASLGGITELWSGTAITGSSRNTGLLVATLPPLITILVEAGNGFSSVIVRRDNISTTRRTSQNQTTGTYQAAVQDVSGNLRVSVQGGNADRMIIYG